MTIPDKYSWLTKLTGVPAELKEALKHHGVLEHAGKGSNQMILGWATEVGVKGWYPDDDVPWCGLFKGVCAKRTGWLKTPKYDLLSALSWLAWGVTIPKNQSALGDTLIFSRNGGGHVGYYIGENDTAYLVYGGNQANSVSFTWIDKKRLVGVRRAKWAVSQPSDVKKIYLTEKGELSKNEA